MSVESRCGPLSPVNSSGRRADTTLVVSTLAEIVACSPASLAGPGDRLLCLEGELVANLPDASSVSALVARVARTAPLPDLVGALIATRPTGALIVGAPDGAFSVALALRDGRVNSAVGPTALQSMGTWVVELHRRAAHASAASRGARTGELVRALAPGRTFVVEAVLDGLAHCDVDGASLLLLQGEMQWLHESLGRPESPDLGFLLMEHARRRDEITGITDALAAQGGVIVPVSRPPLVPGSPPASAANDGWDFFHDQDPAARAEWLDARFVFEFCDGSTNIEGLSERAMLGEFRTSVAVLTLAQRGHVRLVRDEYADFLCDLAS